MSCGLFYKVQLFPLPSIPCGQGPGLNSEEGARFWRICRWHYADLQDARIRFSFREDLFICIDLQFNFFINRVLFHFFHSLF